MLVAIIGFLNYNFISLFFSNSADVKFTEIFGSNSIDPEKMIADKIYRISRYFFKNKYL